MLYRQVEEFPDISAETEAEIEEFETKMAQAEKKRQHAEEARADAEARTEELRARRAKMEEDRESRRVGGKGIGPIILIVGAGAVVYYLYTTGAFTKSTTQAAGMYKLSLEDIKGVDLQALSDCQRMGLM